jgi:hypothetical protein
MNILIFGKGNYGKYLHKELKKQGHHVYFSNEIKPTDYRFFHYTFCTYPANCLKEKLPYIHKYRNNTIVYMATQGYVLEAFHHYIATNPSIAYVFLQYGIYHIRDQQLHRKYSNCNYLLFNANISQTELSTLLKCRMHLSTNMYEFIFNFHNQLIHPAYMMHNRDSKQFYKIPLKKMIACTNTLQKLAYEIFKGNKRTFSWSEYQFYLMYKFPFTWVIDRVMLKIPNVRNSELCESRFFQEDVLSLYYLYAYTNMPKKDTLRKVLEYYEEYTSLAYYFGTVTVGECMHADDLITFLRGRLIHEKIM